MLHAKLLVGLGAQCPRPILQFLEEYARLVREASDIGQVNWDPHRMPFVFLELKGAAYNTDAIDWLWAEVLELGIVHNVALYVMDDTQPSMLAQQTHWQGLLIRGFRVSLCPWSAANHVMAMFWCIQTELPEPCRYQRNQISMHITRRSFCLQASGNSVAFTTCRPAVCKLLAYTCSQLKP